MATENVEGRGKVALRFPIAQIDHVSIVDSAAVSQKNLQIAEIDDRASQRVEFYSFRFRRRKRAR